MRPAPTREPSSAMSTLTATASGVTIECRWMLMVAAPVASPLAAWRRSFW